MFTNCRGYIGVSQNRTSEKKESWEPSSPKKRKIEWSEVEPTVWCPLDNSYPLFSRKYSWEYGFAEFIAEERTAEELTSDSDSEEDEEKLEPIEDENAQKPVIENNHWESEPEETVRKIFENWAFKELNHIPTKVL